jgi:hypothetical protein
MLSLNKQGPMYAQPQRFMMSTQLITATHFIPILVLRAVALLCRHGFAAEHKRKVRVSLLLTLFFPFI